MKRILLLAGEESGLLYANRIADRLRQALPGVTLRGYASEGFKTADLAVIGFAAVARHLFYFLRVKRTMQCVIRTWRPDVVCTIDYPGLNLPLARYAKKQGIRTVHVVCPQVWAWHQGRIPKIEASLDRLCCFFPFEPALFRPGFATFVGHPLAENATAPSTRDEKCVALLPGSRLGEIERILPTLLDAAENLSAQISGLRFVLPAAHARARQAIEHLIAAHNINLTITDGHAREALAQAACAIVASGTATLEAALANCPTALVYRVSPFTAWLARRVITGIRHLGLANIIAEKSGLTPPMPEFLQEDFTAEAVARQLFTWLTDAHERAMTQAQLAQTMSLLDGGGDAIGTIIDTLLEKENS